MNVFSNKSAFLFVLAAICQLLSACNQLSTNLPKPNPVIQPPGAPIQNQGCSNMEVFNFGGTAGSVLLAYEWKPTGNLQIKASIIPDFKSDSYTISLLPSKQNQNVPLEDGKEHIVTFNNVAPNERIVVGFRQKLGPAQFGGGQRSSEQTICQQ